jgi:hypothetical protein
MLSGGSATFLMSEGVQELLQLTNNQFVAWDESLRSVSGRATEAGDAMDLWHILSYLALQPDLKVEKKLAFQRIRIASLKPETIRKYVAKAQRLGFVATVESMGVRHIQLTPTGIQVVSDTMNKWVENFGILQTKFFSHRSHPRETLALEPLA